jgi:glucose-6-phosphate 1-dehydrogenase
MGEWAALDQGSKVPRGCDVPPYLRISPWRSMAREGRPPLREFGLHAEKGPPMIERLVVFGATGDLTGRLLMPALAELAESGRLTPQFTVSGASNLDWSKEEFREHTSSQLAEHAAHVQSATRDLLVGLVDYQPADVTRLEDVKRVLGTDGPDTLVYLALPSGLIEGALSALAGAGLGRADAIAIEKPFGTDLASAQHLNEMLRTMLPLPTVFRVDHFLSSELVRRVVTLRFLNRLFEASWNADSIERVDISWLESLTLEGRADYYDQAGALKDMLQNHLMEVMSLVLMEQPARMDADSFRGARVEALRAVATPSPQQIRSNTIRARYTAGMIGDRKVPDYNDEPGVHPERNTETYASLTLEVDNPRWSGVPFTLRSGKALPEFSAEIAVHYRPLPRYLLDRYPGVEPNVLRIGLQEPYIGLTTTVNGPEQSAEVRELEMRSTPMKYTPYANLFVEMLRGDPTLLIQGDEAEEAWRIVDPVLAGWAAGEVPMQTYRAGDPPPDPELSLDRMRRTVVVT